MRTKVEVDRGSELWRTCVHEAAHYHVARGLGWRAGWPRIYSASRGHTPSELPGGSVEFSAKTAHRFVEKAVIDLAGPVAEGKLTWLPSGGGGDRDSARSALRGTGVSMSQARSKAASQVRRHWSQIKSSADRLYLENV